MGIIFTGTVKKVGGGLRVATIAPPVVPAFTIEQSLLFNDDDNSRLNRTPAGVGDVRNTWTFSTWFKRGNLGSGQTLMTAFESAATNETLQIDSNDHISYKFQTSNTNRGRFESAEVFRDPAAWYHLSISRNDDTFTFHMNNVALTDTDATGSAAGTNNGTFNSANLQNLGAITGDGSTFIAEWDGLMSQTAFIDGLALDPTSFGEFDSNGDWQPIDITGLTYGTNGFLLSYADNSSVAALGTDTSGNGNDWTPNGAPGFATTDQVSDSPSIGSSNYATINPLAIVKFPLTLSNGNLTMTKTTGGTDVNISTFAVPASSNWYAEFTIDTVPGGSNVLQFGVIKEGDAELYDTGEPRISQGAEGYAYITNWSATPVPSKANNSVETSYGTLGVATDVIGVHLNAGVLTFLHNNVSQGVAFSGLTGNFFFGTSIQATTGTAKVTANFGQKAFAFTPPSEALKLNSSNLSTPAIANPGAYFNPVLYTGNGTSQSISDVDFQPDLVWIKERSSTSSHVLSNSVSGAGKHLVSSSDAIELTDATQIPSFDATGFSVGSSLATNEDNETYVAWNWKEGITPGFDIVSYTGNATNRTIAHNLGAEPDLMIVKNRDTAIGWIVYHSANTSAPETEFLRLDNTAATLDFNFVWNDTAPDADFFTVGTDSATNQDTKNMIAYLWAGVEDFSKFGSYVGNGDPDGPFVYCGFRPAYVMLKRSVGGVGSWIIHDNKREPNNVSDEILYADDPGVATSAGSHEIDMLSNGFKLRNTSTEINASGSTYIFAAFAESPFKTARAR